MQRAADVPVLVNERDPRQAYVAGTLEADAPLAGLFPTGVGLDALHNWVKMSSIASDAREDPTGALHRARALVAAYSSAGRSPRALTWFMPTLCEVGDMHTVIQRGATLGLNDARRFEHLKESGAWRAMMAEHVEVRRAWGRSACFGPSWLIVWKMV